MWARYVILRVLKECGDFVTIDQVTGSDGEPDLVIRINRQLIETVGHKAIGDFLRKLQVHYIIMTSL